MGMLARIAWRNIWRNKRRSWVLISAISIGVFCFVGSMTFADGFSIQLVNTSIELDGGHIQLSSSGYSDNPTIRSRIRNLGYVEDALDQTLLARYSPQVVTSGMVNSAEQASGVRLVGVDPLRERGVSSIPERIVEGEYLSSGVVDGEVVIGVSLADRLNVTVGEKIVVMVSDLENEVSAGAYRVRGLFTTNSAEYDRMMVFVHLDEARRLLGYSTEEASTISVHLDPEVDLKTSAAALRGRLTDVPVDVLTWEDRMPMLVLMRQTYDVFSVALVLILFSAISFSIINSFLMVIFERIREIGIMSANGLRPMQIFSMLYLEAAFIVILGLLVGGIVAAGLVAWWAETGLDLSAFAEGMRSFNLGTVIYPYVDWRHIWTGVITIFIVVFLSVLYPAFKASRFRAVEAINYV
ncbi:MAG: ABC transporter permease [Rhodothermales bacterium]|nr:ABC transporter permease [Rhodothermales bacterium]